MSKSAPASNLDAFMQQACDTLNDPRTTSADAVRIRQIAADAIKTAAKGSLSIALLLLTLSTQALASNPTSNPQNIRQGLPSCLNQPDKNGPRPGCG